MMDEVASHPTPFVPNSAEDGLQVSYATLSEALVSHPVLAGLSLCLRKRRDARHSEIFIYRSGLSRGEQIVVKRAKGVDRAAIEDHLTREFRSLLKVRRCLGSELRRSVPEPILVLPRAGALVLRAVPGTDLNCILRKQANCLVGMLRARYLASILYRGGRWLRSFHDASHQGYRQFVPDSFLSVAEMRLDMCRASGLSQPVIDEVSRLIRAAADRSKDRAEPTAYRHGDFIPQNILVDQDGGIALVDFENLHERDSVYYDLGALTGYLLLMEKSRMYSRRTLSRLRQSFLEGYGGPLDEDLLGLYIARCAITVASEYRSGPRGRDNLHPLERRLVKVCGDLLRT